MSPVGQASQPGRWSRTDLLDSDLQSRGNRDYSQMIIDRSFEGCA